MKDKDLTIDIHTNIKNDISEIADNKEILDALKKVIKIPDSIISLRLDLSANDLPRITFTEIAKKEKQ